MLHMYIASNGPHIAKRAMAHGFVEHKKVGWVSIESQTSSRQPVKDSSEGGSAHINLLLGVKVVDLVIEVQEGLRREARHDVIPEDHAVSEVLALL